MLSALTAFATKFTYNGVPYTVYDEMAKTCMVSPVLRGEPNNVMSGQIDLPEKVYDGDKEYSLVKIGYMAFSNTNVTKVTIPQSVTFIDDRAFMNCSTLESVNIPDGVTVIGSGVFQRCAALGEISLHDGITEIGHSAFSGCSSLTNVDIPARVTMLGQGCFQSCNQLMRVTLPMGLTAIPRNCFSGCRSLSKIDIPSSVTYIGSLAFSNCSLLESIVIPENVEEIGTGAFRQCNGLQQVVALPLNAPAIGENTFSFAGNIGRKLTVPQESGFDYIVNGWITNTQSSQQTVSGFCEANVMINTISDGMLTYAIDKGSNRAAVLPSPNGYYPFEEIAVPSTINGYTVSAIGAGAFSDNYVTGKVTIPETVTEISNMAFLRCDNLAELVMPESLNELGAGAFSNCSKLKEVVVPKGVTAIRDNTFTGSSIEKVVLPDGVKSLGESAFELSRDLKSVNLPEGLESISAYAFYECSAMESLELPATVKSIGFSAFQSMNELRSINIPDGVERISAGAYCMMPNLTELVVPSSVEVVEYQGCCPAYNNEAMNLYVGESLRVVGFQGLEGHNIYISAQEPPIVSGVPSMLPSTMADITVYVQGTEAVKRYQAVYPWNMCTIRDMVPAETVKTNVSFFKGQAGDTFQCTATIVPADASMPQIFWKSTDERVATVSETGLVTIIDYSKSDDHSDYQTCDAPTGRCQIIASTLYHDGPLAVIEVENETLGVEEITVEAAGHDLPRNIFNLQGVCIKRNATDDDVRSLAPGLYIIGGQKTFIR